MMLHVVWYIMFCGLLTVLMLRVNDIVNGYEDRKDEEDDWDE